MTPVELKCARCSASLRIFSNDVAGYARVSGWCRTAIVPGGIAKVALPDGRVAHVRTEATSVETPWACGQAHALEYATAKARDPDHWSLDASGHPDDPRLRRAEPQRTEPHEVTILCRRVGCGAQLTLARSRVIDPALFASALEANGWRVSGPAAGAAFCSARCGILVNMEAAAPAPVITLGDATVRGRLEASKAAEVAAKAVAGKRAR
ncbi:MAG: hypothetical protein M3O50_08470 [Myxococcota bacterium]|nr:hypothetical protein [Myxococcota bacterium]